MAVELRRSSEFSLSQLAAIFTAAYEGYVVPFVVDEASLAYMVDAFDLDLTRSFVAVEAGRPIGLANLGLRGERAWLGGVGVVPPHRGAGIGELLTRNLLDGARAAGAREMALEVIVENVPAITLYGKLGFARTRELEVLSLAAAEGGHETPAGELDEALELIAARRDAPEPWQRHDDTVANLARRQPAPQTLAVDGATAVFRMEGESVSLLQAAGEPPSLRSMVAVLRSYGTVTAVNYAAGSTVALALREAGAELRVRQYEMVA